MYGKLETFLNQQRDTTMRKIILASLILLVSGCSTSLTKRAYNIETGMSKQSVLQRMGVPDRRSMRGADEALQYSEIVGFGQCGYIIVWISEGKVVAVTNRSGPSIAGCGLGSKEVDWGQIPKPEMTLNINIKNQ